MNYNILDPKRVFRTYRFKVLDVQYPAELTRKEREEKRKDYAMLCRDKKHAVEKAKELQSELVHENGQVCILLNDKIIWRNY